MRENSTGKLDEMQNQKLLKLEEYGFWIMFWALLISIFVQLFAGAGIRQIIGEFIVLLVGSVYLSITTLRNGLWTRTATPSRKGNAITSIIPAVLLGVINVIRLAQNNGITAKALLLTAAITLAAYAACFMILELFRAFYNKRRAELDDTDEESEGK